MTKIIEFKTEKLTEHTYAFIQTDAVIATIDLKGKQNTIL